MAVVISGMGVASPLGVTVESMWENLIKGRSGITRLQDRFDKNSLDQNMLPKLSKSNLSTHFV